MSVKTVETGTLVTIDVVATDHLAENLDGMPVAIKETVEVEIDMEIEIDTTIVVIGETVVITIIESEIVLVAPRGDRVLLFETDWKGRETIGIEDPGRFLGIAETEISSKSGTMVEIGKGIERETTKETATINIRILYQRA